VVRQRSAKPSFAGSIPAVASNSFSLRTPPDFSFVSTVESHGWYALAPFRWSFDEKILRRPEVIDGEVVDLEISARDVIPSRSEESGRRLRSRLGMTVKVIGATGATDVRQREVLTARLTRMFQLHVDTSEFLAFARQSPPHAWVVKAKFGRLLCGSTLFEDVVKIITTTNTTWQQTKRMVELLVEKCGRKSSSGAYAFPSAEEVARFSAAELQRDCRLGYRAKAISQLAGGGFDLSRLSDPSQTTAELFASYKTLPGIGPYGAAHLLAMDGRHDFIAVDTEFRRFVRETYHRGRKVSDKAMLRRYAKWGRWKYLAYWSELWASVADALHPRGGEDK
jgi:3-methyladenine DNA glycosylase/8-oxoguanine DNA glycosylase